MLLSPRPLAAALLLCWAALTQAQNLSELAPLARAHDAALQAAQAQWQAAQSRAQQAQAGLLPSAALTGSAGYARTDVSRPPIDLHAPTQSLAVQASQPLYRPANRITLQQAERGVELARAQLDAAEQDLLVRLGQRYFDVLGAQDTLQALRAQKKAVQEQLAAAQRNFEVGTATITDAREAQARHDLVQAQELAAQNEWQVRQLALDDLVGRAGVQPTPLASPTPLPSLPTGTLQEWAERAHTQQPLVRQALLAVDVARLETAKAETGHLPTLDLQAGYALQRQPNGSVTAPGIHSRANVASVGLALNLPLFAGFAVQNRVRETLSLQERAQADLDNARRSAAQAARSAFLGVQSGRAQVQALQAAEASSQLALQANLLGYEAGMRVNIDVLNAQSQLYQTQRDLALARYQVLVGTLRLKQAAGTLELQDVQALDSLLAR